MPSQPNTYAGPGYLSSAFAPFSLGADPANGGFRVQDLTLPGGVDDKRFTARRTMLDAVNDHFAAKEKADGLEAMDTFYQRAYSLISSQKAREAFNINAEPAGPPRRVWPQRRRPADADGPAAGGGRRALRVADLRRLGHAHRHQGRHAAASCRTSTRRSPR